MPVEIRSPSVVPSFASSVTVALAERKQQHLAGRYCAAQAIERLEPSAASSVVGRGSAGQPQWPAGLTGSVTHTDGLASAAVARLTDARSIGIDSEMRVDRARAERIRTLVMLPEERALGGDALDDGTRVALVFSAKEAIFKCLYPVVERRFYYEDARITSVDLATGSFAAKLMTTLAPGFDCETVVRGRFEIDSMRVHTGVWLEPYEP